MGVLIGERTGFYRLAAELLEPLKLHGAVVTDLNAVLEGFADRVRASCGTTRTALLRAADLVILVTAFCETVAAFGIRYTTELGHEQADLTSDVVAELERVTLGSQRVRHPADLRAEIAAAYAYAADTVCDESGVGGQQPDKLAHRAWRRYEARRVLSASSSSSYARSTSRTVASASAATAMIASSVKRKLSCARYGFAPCSRPMSENGIRWTAG